MPVARPDSATPFIPFTVSAVAPVASPVCVAFVTFEVLASIADICAAVAYPAFKLVAAGIEITGAVPPLETTGAVPVTPVTVPLPLAAMFPLNLLIDCRILSLAVIVPVLAV